MDRAILEFIETYIKAIREDNAAIFAGAGLSVSTGLVNWKELLREIAEELGLDVDQEHDLIEIAQFYRNEKCGRGNINQKLIEEFTKDVSISAAHKILAQLPIKTYWTTNYDSLIEKALELNGKVVDIKIVPDNFSVSKPGRKAVVYKMHGDISMPNDAVLTKDDYECYNEKRQMFTTALQGDLVTKTFLFWGFSFDDPNLEYILSRIRLLLGENTRNHYCFLRKIVEKDYNSRDDYVYQKTRQELKIQDLKRYSIQALLVDEYKDITDIFHLIYKRLREDKIFISGAAALYKGWNQTDAERFVYDLAYCIAKKNMKIVSGFGWGIGSSTINGVLSYVYSLPSAKIEDYLTMRPFPQNISDKAEREKLWRNYRTDMLSDVGIAIFLFGNKEKDGNIVDSDGMIDEFNIAVNKGIMVIPVGCTQDTSKTIWDKVMENPKEYYGENPELITIIQELGDMDVTNVDEIIKKIVKAIDLIKDKRRKRL